MRRVCLILVLGALSVPGTALALPGVEQGTALAALVQASGQGDGSLAVTGGNGTLVVQGHGVIFGYFVSGSLVVIAYRPDTPNATVSVAGATAHTDSGVTTYTGSAVRFLLPAGHYTIELIANGIDVSAVGRGTAGATAGSSFSAGSLALDGGKSVPFAKLTGPQLFGTNKGT